MFEERTPDSAAPAAQPEPAAAPTWGEIYTMPSQGRASGPTSAQPTPSASRSRLWLTLAVVGVVLAIGGVGIYLLFFRTSPPPAVTEQPAPVVPSTPPTPTTPTQPPVTTPTPTTAAERDSRRYLDVRNIQSGLELYFATAKHYPVAALPLALGQDTTKVMNESGFIATPAGTSYLTVVPANPAPGGHEYLYESLDGTSYTISFQLEEGAAGLVAGEHKASPQGIDGLATSTPPGSGPTTPRTLQLPTLTNDGDGDGLTDAEEPLFGTDPAKADTDGDTYADGLEVEQGYDPAVAAGALLKDSANFSTYDSTRFGYSVQYPKAWLAKAHDAEGSEVIFSGAGAEFIEVLVVDNPQHLSAQEWYAKQVPGSPVQPSDVPTVTAGDNTWALSYDGLNAYLASGTYLITLSYNIGPATEASFYHLFRSMLGAFHVTSAATPEPPATPPPAGAGDANTNTSGDVNGNENTNASPPPGA